MAEPASAYIMGHTDRERSRLSLQGSILNPYTERFLRGAGIESGMRVLDLGCGVGEVSQLIAGIVGPEGHVTGVDLDLVALELARTRVGEAGLSQAAFLETNLADFQPERQFDAVTGRHILIHTPDPPALVRKAASAVRLGGIVAFQEFDCLDFVPGYPRQPLAENVSRWLTTALRQNLPHADCGNRIYHWLCEAGLKAVSVHGDVMIDGGPDSSFYNWIAESLRSVMPLVEAAGIATAAEIDIDTLPARLREEAVACNGSTPGVVMIGAHGRAAL